MATMCEIQPSRRMNSFGFGGGCDDLNSLTEKLSIRPSTLAFNELRSNATTYTPEKEQAGDASAKTPAQRSNSSRYKTELCRPYMETGNCRYGEKCQFAHGPNEQRAIERHPKYKTEACRTFHKDGFCPYGSRCHFVHEAAETREEFANTPGQGSGALPEVSSNVSNPPTPHENAARQSVLNGNGSAASPIVRSHSQGAAYSRHNTSPPLRHPGPSKMAGPPSPPQQPQQGPIARRLSMDSGFSTLSPRPQPKSSPPMLTAGSVDSPASNAFTVYGGGLSAGYGSGNGSAAMTQYRNKRNAYQRSMSMPVPDLPLSLPFPAGPAEMDAPASRGSQFPNQIDHEITDVQKMVTLTAKIWQNGPTEVEAASSPQMIHSTALGAKW